MTMKLKVTNDDEQSTARATLIDVREDGERREAYSEELPPKTTKDFYVHEGRELKIEEI